MAAKIIKYKDVLVGEGSRLYELLTEKLKPEERQQDREKATQAHYNMIMQWFKHTHYPAQTFLPLRYWGLSLDHITNSNNN